MQNDITSLSPAELPVITSQKCQCDLSSHCPPVSHHQPSGVRALLVSFLGSLISLTIALATVHSALKSPSTRLNPKHSSGTPFITSTRFSLLIFGLGTLITLVNPVFWFDGNEGYKKKKLKATPKPKGKGMRPSMQSF